MQTSLSPSVCGAFLGCQIEKAVDELNLTRKIISCHPSSLPLPDHVDCFVALNRSLSRLEFSEALLGVHSTFDGDRKSTRLNSSHLGISYAVFCLKKTHSHTDWRIARRARTSARLHCSRSGMS